MTLFRSGVKNILPKRLSIVLYNIILVIIIPFVIELVLIAWSCIRHHNFSQQAKEVEIEEVGPRFEMRLYQIRLGTVDMVEAETEWSLRPYMNTAKAKQNL